jgi:hypothetical protein
MRDQFLINFCEVGRGPNAICQWDVFPTVPFDGWLEPGG